MDYSWVLRTWLVLLTCIYHLSVITREYVLRAWQDSPTSITRTTGFTREYSVITREYKSARQELLTSIFNLSAIACKQYASHITWAWHTSYLQNFQRHKALLAFFVNLNVSCTVCIIYFWKETIQENVCEWTKIYKIHEHFLSWMIPNKYGIWHMQAIMANFNLPTNSQWGYERSWC